MPQWPREVTEMPDYTACADDVDFVSKSSQLLNEVQRIAPVCLSKWCLNIRESARRGTEKETRGRSGLSGSDTTVYPKTSGCDCTIRLQSLSSQQLVHVWTNANGKSHVSFIPPSSAETSHWNQLPSAILITDSMHTGQRRTPVILGDVDTIQ